MQGLIAEAQDSAGNGGYSANKGLSFPAVTDTAQPDILIDTPPPTSEFGLDEAVVMTFHCSDAGSVQSCTGSDGRACRSRAAGRSTRRHRGRYTLTVTATDLSGNATQGSMAYFVRYQFLGFYPPIANPPVLNVVKAGSTIDQVSLKDANDQFIRDLNAVASLLSTRIV